MSDEILKIVDRSIAQLPDDLPKDDVSKVRMELFKQLKKAARRAGKAHGLLLYLPIERIHGTVIPASFIVSEPIPASGPGAQTDQILAMLAADRGDSESVEIDGSAGLRFDRIVPPTDDAADDPVSRRIEYVLPVPGSAIPRWLAITFDGVPPSGVADQAGGIRRSRPESPSPAALLGLAEPGPAVIARRTAAARTGRLRSGGDGP
ncbi:hypothetical protein [Streptomyces sp. P17]|uniref:hypothetical protein n=1 Tax=Streptomyces sp. P17 TaxID=3074716 RepID=UPI0028F458FB|nr:hypothetical protein [Streptomyces sp. P17]MDT9701757.1 hypothetical protein [Streptomyces sp. P17]